jgi:tRNA(Ile2)-agmatinylcytidine synthase
VVRVLRPGDEVVVSGGVRETPRCVNIERIDVIRLVADEVRNPRCGDCRKSMESAGRGQGYRCARCGSKAARKARVPLARAFPVGAYEAAMSAMRHLHRPTALDAASEATSG